MPRIDHRLPLKIAAAAVLMSAILGACSDLYHVRSDYIHSSAGDANASNIASQTIDPWPRHAANRNIESNGERTQAAIQRYREGKVTPPRGLGTSSIEVAPSAASPK